MVKEGVKVIEISSSLLRDKLSIVGNFIENNSIIPILESVHISISKGMMYLTGSDMENTVKIKIDVNIEGEYSFCIPYKELKEVLSTLSEDITILYDETSQRVEVKYKKGSFSFPSYNGNEYPQAPKQENDIKLIVDAQVFSDIINKTTPFCSKDELRPQMCGVYFSVKESKMTAAATDANKLIEIDDIDLKSEIEDAEFVVSSKALQKMKNIIKNYEIILIEKNDTHISFRTEFMKITSRVVDGKFPNYKAVIPVENDKKLKIDKSELLESIKRIGISSNQTTKSIKLEINNNVVDISSEDIGLGRSAKESLFVEIEGDAIILGFNYNFLEQTIKSIDDDNIVIEMSQQNRAAIIKTENDNYKQLNLLMPVIVN